MVELAFKGLWAGAKVIPGIWRREGGGGKWGEKERERGEQVTIAACFFLSKIDIKTQTRKGLFKKYPRITTLTPLAEKNDSTLQ